MFAVVYEEVFAKIAKNNSDHSRGLLLGRRIDDEYLVQISDAMEETTVERSLQERVLAKKQGVIGIYIQATELDLNESCEKRDAFLPEKLVDGAIVLLASQKDAKVTATVYEFVDGCLNKIDHVIAAIDSGLFKRVQRLVQSETLSNKKVTVVGLGSGGSTIALELAKCGVSRFALVDYDRIEVHNLSRHICGISDLGRYKTHAVKDRVLEHNPKANVETYEIDVLTSRDAFGKIIGNSDLVVAASGSPVVNNFTNELCLLHKIPAVYGGVWERAMGGYVMRVIPELTACYNCIHEAFLKNAPILDKSRVIDYSAISDPNELKAEPGLSIDVSIVSLLQAKMSLSLLLSVDNAKNDIPQDYVIWFNKSYDQFKPLTCLKAHVKRRDDCAVCNYEKWLKKVEGLQNNRESDKCEL